MSDLRSKIAVLSPEQLELLQLRLGRMQEQKAQPALPQISARRRESNAFPLSFEQQRLWQIQRLNPSSPVFNVPLAYDLSGPLNLYALERSLNEIMSRHEVLRTTFAVVDGQPAQLIAPASAMKLKPTGLQDVPSADRESLVTRLIGEEARQPFDLTERPPLRVSLFRLDADRHIVVLNIHHIIFDAWSLGAFFNELAVLYKAFSKNEASPLKGPAIQYVDFVLWQRDQLNRGALEAQLTYWRRQMSGSRPVLKLPSDSPVPSVRTLRGDLKWFTLESRLIGSLRDLGQRERATLFMTLLTAFKILLSKYTGQEDILVGTDVSNRSRPETEELIGFFVNQLALRTDLSGDPTSIDLLKRVRETTLQAYAHQDLPILNLVESLGHSYESRCAPLFTVLFKFQPNRIAAALGFTGLTTNTINLHSGTSGYDLTMSLIESTDGGMTGILEYSTDLFSTGNMARFINQYQALLETIVNDPGQRISTLRISGTHDGQPRSSPLATAL